MNKLELTWIGKDEKIKIEPRILIEDNNLSNLNYDKNTDNILIHGDNLLALKALEKDYSGKVKCVYIDPPYNTGAAFEHYDDNVEHSTWLNLMKPRLEIIKTLLTDDGMLFVQIDDNEQAYLTVLLDEIFGRANRINTICVNMSNMSGVKIKAAIQGKRFPKIKEYILVYCKNKDNYKLKIPKFSKAKWDNEYNMIIPQVTENDFEKIEMNNADELVESMKNWELVSLLDYKKANNISEKNIDWNYENSYRIVASKPNKSLLSKCSKLTFDKNEDIACITSAQGLNKLITTKFNRTTKTARIELVFAKSNLEVFYGDHWSDIVTTGGVGQEGGVEFKNSKKPEKLVSRIIACSTKEGDLVLDSFLGSGTTAAVAHKMNRRWIGIEMGDHAYTLAKPRLDSVISGTDKTGITDKFKWTKGGGYKFYELAPSLLNKDCFGELIINKEYNPEMLASAVALHEGFKFCPDDKCFWKQSKSTEDSYLYVTTNYLSLDFIKEIDLQMGSNEHLNIVCKAYDKGCINYSPRITVKKLPQCLLGKCTYDKDNYDLNIVNPPLYEDEEMEDFDYE